MTKIAYETYYDTHLIECVGHTEYTPGADILCSAVSALCYALREYLNEAEEAGKVMGVQVSLEKGFFAASFRLSEDSDATEGVSAILCGFKVLEGAFPDHISLDI